MIGFLFAGQGSQTEAMGFDLYQNYPDIKELFDSLDTELKDVLTTNNPLIHETKFAQPAIFLISLLLAKKVEEKIKPDFLAGLSLGEYSALSFSGVFSLKDGLDITKKRGLIMQEALKDTNSGMYALIGGDLNVVEEVVKETPGVEIANYNCPGQIVITGYNKNLEEAVQKLTSLGIKRAVKLNVTGAFHSSLLNEASELLYSELQNYTFNKPNLKVVYNTTGSESNKDIKENLKEQIKSSVLFEQTIKYMIDKGVRVFFEIGSKNNLASFVKKINKDVEVYSIYDFATLENLGGYNESSNRNG